MGALQCMINVFSVSSTVPHKFLTHCNTTPHLYAFTHMHAITFTPPHAHHHMHTTTCTPSHAHHHMHTITCTPSHAHHHMHTTTCTSPHAHHGRIFRSASHNPQREELNEVCPAISGFWQSTCSCDWCV